MALDLAKPGGGTSNACFGLQSLHSMNVAPSAIANHPHYFRGISRNTPAMIVLKISNSSEVVAAKVGKFLEFLTPDSIDQATVEDQVIKKLVENLVAEGIKGEVAAVKGLELEGAELSLQDGMKVRRHESF